MKVVVLGAGGIIGQHLAVTVPFGIKAIFTRTAEPNHIYHQLDVTKLEAADWVNEHNPNIIINLVGECRPDVVEAEPDKYREANSLCVANMASWCDDEGSTLIHVSSQAALDPVNAYGKQKLEVDEALHAYAKNWVIVRPTFVLGIRPFPGIGRENPVERILSGKEKQSVNDRYFAVSFAWDVAEYIWNLCQAPMVHRQVHYVGHPDRLSRYDLACILDRSGTVTPVSHNSLPGLAPRPLDTSEAYAHAHRSKTLAEQIVRLRAEWESREADDLHYRAKELAAFLRVPYWDVEAKLYQGFGPLHNAVTADFHSKNPVTEAELLEWYRVTDSYLFELSAYHVDAGFNYRGMVGGIAQALKSKGVDRVLCLGDGTGDLTLAMHDAGMTPFYNDLFLSTTASFAESRFAMRLGDDWQRKIGLLETASFDPPMTPMERLKVAAPQDPEFNRFDAIVSLDFLEHLPEGGVEKWVRSVYENLKPGGFFVAQNAYGMGSGPDGAMPMHLAVNDKWVTEWDPFLSELGFVQLASNWYQKPMSRYLTCPKCSGMYDEGTASCLSCKVTHTSKRIRLMIRLW